MCLPINLATCSNLAYGKSQTKKQNRFRPGKLKTRKNLFSNRFSTPVFEYFVVLLAQRLHYVWYNVVLHSLQEIMHLECRLDFDYLVEHLAHLGRLEYAPKHRRELLGDGTSATHHYVIAFVVLSFKFEQFFKDKNTLTCNSYFHLQKKLTVYIWIVFFKVYPTLVKFRVLVQHHTSIGSLTHTHAH